jgi:S-DNA-T family DNA segregation ATPase FtsK/SpoIIIE
VPTISAESSLKKSQEKRANERAEPTIKKSIKPFNSNFSSRAFEEPGGQGARYILPSLSLLNSSNEKNTMTKELERKNSEFSSKLETILKEYGVEGKIVNFKTGPVVTLYEFLPAAGVKTSKVVGLSEDIARAMSSLSARISSQPGKTSIGIEIPNPRRESVLLGDLIKDENFISNNNGLTLALGKNIDGEKKFTDLEKMPHLLIAGTTGSGKSVGLNSMIISLLYRFTPSECKLILIDPKMLELSIYENIPHLLTPVVTNPHKAIFALKWVVREMENRYKLMTSINVKNIRSFNAKILSTKSLGRRLFREVQTGVDSGTRLPIIEKKELPLEKMPLIVVVIDEMADLMMIAGKEVENLVQRLAQMARASGIHLIAATQRPSVDVITGTIKANFPSRISFRVASRFDSRTILNEMGAEQLLGSGDMLFLENGAYVTRLHGGFVSESEIEAVVNFIKSQKTNETQHDITVEKTNVEKSSYDLGFSSNNVDTLYDKALTLVLEQQKVSTSFIQRYLQIGYNRAARIVEKMEEDGFISEPSHAGKRSVLKKNK